MPYFFCSKTPKTQYVVIKKWLYLLFGVDGAGDVNCKQDKQISNEHAT